ncbi:MAG: DUF4252 domain-containing protein [Candidatus Latescibacterota bacterium]
MRKRYVQIAAILVMAMLLCSGCLWAPGLERLKNEITAQLPGARFDKEVALTLGPMSLMLARAAVRFVPEAQEARDYLSEVRRVELAVYQTEYLPPLDDLQFPKHLSNLLNDDWEIAARVRDHNEVVWVLYHDNGQKIDCMCAVILDEENLVLVKVQGNLGKLVLKGLREGNIYKGA